MENLLEIKNLEIRAGQGKGNILCHTISLSVPKKSIVGLVGESGSGKTLTSLAILGLLPPGLAVCGGEIVFQPVNSDPSDLLTLSSKNLQKIRGNQIGMIFQEPMTSLNPSMTCGKQVLEGIMNHKNIASKQAVEQVLRLFETVKLPNPLSVYKSFPHQLSGGQRQRVMIASAVCCNPSLLIADEPTTALDVTVQQSIFALIKELQTQSDMSVLFISHDLGIISQLADEIVVMYKGEVVESGPAQKIMNNPEHPYTQGLLSCRPANYKKGLRLLSLYQEENSSHNSPAPLPENTNELLLQVKNMAVSFHLQGKSNFLSRKKIQVLEPITFDVRKGETLGLVGESGSGKTTLSRALLRLITSSSDSILYRQIPLDKLHGEALRKFRKNIQIIFQDPYSSLNPKQTILEIIMEPMIVHGLHSNNENRRRKAAELLEKVQLGKEFTHRYPHQLSGGQRQRVGIARALAVEPELIICDESVSALDVSVQAQVLNLLNDLKNEFQLTYIFISHDLNVVRYMSDRIIVLQSGKMMESGNTEDIFLDPQTDYTRKLIEAIPGKAFQ